MKEKFLASVLVASLDYRNPMGINREIAGSRRSILCGYLIKEYIKITEIRINLYFLKLFKNLLMIYQSKDSS